MRYEYINSFVDSAQTVMESIMPSDIRRGGITLQDSLLARGISATIFLVGGVDGRVVLDLEPPVARKIAGLMNNAEFDHVDHLVLDTICELTNIIIGKAVTSLNNMGFRFRPSPPCFFVGTKEYHGLESLCISLATEWGEMRIQAAIRDMTGINQGSSGGEHRIEGGIHAQE
jgi:CheY-specific phosphatase CheX